MKKRIIIIEDEKNISDSLKIILENEGMFVTVYDRGLDGLANFASFDLLVLDLMLPDVSGLKILHEIRTQNPRFPVLIVSAKSGEEDLIQGLQMGADDYITKPFSIAELLLRIKRALERNSLFEQNLNPQDSIFCFGTNSIDFKNLIATSAKGTIQITPQEANILYYLTSSPGRLISRQELIEKIWGHNRNIESRTIDNFIVRFRKNFEENPKKPKFFITKRGIGYIFTN